MPATNGKGKTMTTEMDKLAKLDEHLVCANVAGRKRLGFLGVVEVPALDNKLKKYVLFYDFTQNEQEPLLPIGVINSTQELNQVFGPWADFFQSQADFSEWAEQVDTKQLITPLSIARAYLCSTGKLALPDSDTLIQQTLSQKSVDKPLGFGMSPELVEAWFQWAIQEDENSRSYSRARKNLSQAIADTANCA